MGYYSGNTGTLQFKKFQATDYQDNDAVNLRVTQWTMNSSAQLLDTTTLGEYDKNSVYGLRTHTGTLRLLYYTDGDYSTPATNAAAYFIDALAKPKYIQNRANSDFAGDVDDNGVVTPDSYAVRLKLYLKGPLSNDRDESVRQDAITFDANLTSVGYASTVGEVTSVQVQFEAFGRIDISNL